MEDRKERRGDGSRATEMYAKLNAAILEEAQRFKVAGKEKDPDEEEAHYADIEHIMSHAATDEDADPFADLAEEEAHGASLAGANEPPLLPPAECDRLAIEDAIG